MHPVTAQVPEVSQQLSRQRFQTLINLHVGSTFASHYLGASGSTINWVGSQCWMSLLCFLPLSGVDVPMSSKKIVGKWRKQESSKDLDSSPLDFEGHVPELGEERSPDRDRESSPKGQAGHWWFFFLKKGQDILLLSGRRVGRPPLWTVNRRLGFVRGPFLIVVVGPRAWGIRGGNETKMGICKGPMPWE